MQQKQIVIAVILGLIFTSVGAVLGPIPIYLKDDDTAQTRDEIITTGTRVSNRIVIESMVPIDILSSTDFATQSADNDTIDALANLLPSFVVSRVPIGDGSTFVRPPTIRGLAADQTLVLINGKRRHRSALVQLDGGGTIVGRGTQGVDLSLIPGIAIKKVEVLRDGASAQYGSDAIAGVMNFILKDGNNEGSASIQYGQFQDGDGQNIKLGFNQGFALQDDRGFLNFSLEYKESDPTSRGSSAPGDAALNNLLCDAECKAAVPKLGDSPYPAQTWGDPESRSLLTFLNGELKLANSTLYFVANYAEKSANGSFYYRNPFSKEDVFGLDYNNYFKTKFPGGFVPRFFGDTTDYSQLIGLKGGDEATLKWDVSAYYGSNELTYALENTVNPSLLEASPTSFKPGSLQQTDLNLNVDFSKIIAPKSLPNPVHLAFGFEYRKEQYEVKVGDEASYKSDDTDIDLAVGSNGFQGFSPEAAGKSSQTNTAIYLDAETNLNEQLQLGVAARIEDFDTFGNTTDGKVSMRYVVDDNFAVRSSYSTGFRAPSTGQANTINFATTLDNSGVLVATATIPADSDAAILLGSKPLTPETSNNFNLGFTWNKNNLNLSADYYNVKVKNRISFSKEYEDEEITNAVKAALKKLGLNNVTTARFFANSIDTTTSGIDLVASTNTKISGGQLDLVAAFNHNKTKVDRSELDPYEVVALEKQNPTNRLNLSARFSRGKYSLLARANWYDKWTEIYFSNDYQRVGAEWTLDLESSYKIAKDATLIIGSKNILNTYPDRITITEAKSDGINYPVHSPFGFNGAFWYAGINYSF